MAHSKTASHPSALPDRQQNLRDAMVVGSITMCALALGLGLYLQFGLTFWLAIVTALSAYVALVFAHVAVRRSSEVALLRAEVDQLRRRIPAAQEPRGDVVSADVAVTKAAPSSPLTEAAPPAGVAFDGQPLASPVTEPQLPPWPEPGEGQFSGASRIDPMRRPAHLAVRSEPSLQMPPIQAQPAAIAEPQARELTPGTTSSTAVEFDRLQELIKELASSVGGPRAASSDPDLWPTTAGSQAMIANEAATDRAVAALSTAAATGAPYPLSAREDAGFDVPATGIQPAPRRDSRRPVSDPRHTRLVEALEAERVEVYLEPIQGLGDRRPHHFEVSVRLRDALGTELSEHDVAELARSSGLLPKLDAVKLPRVLRVARRIKGSGRPADVLASIAGESLGDNGFIDRFAAELMSNERIRIVFTFSEADVRAFGRVHWQTLEAMADIGIRFALDQVVTLDIDLDRLKSVGFDFVKLDASVFLAGLPSPGGVIPAVDICRHLSSQGLTLIVSHIEDEWALARVMGFGALFGQGTLFGAPRPVRADVLADAA